MKILVSLLLATTTLAGTYTNGPLIQVSTTNVFSDCTADDVAGQIGIGSTIFTNSEVEPWIVVNPINTSNVVGIWQQDRWNDGGSRGDVIGASFDGGVTWQAVQIPGTTLCTGGTFQRASDPWLSFAPDGTLHALVLAIDQDPETGGFGANAILTSRSIDGGLNWSTPVMLAQTNDPVVLNDKDALTADPTDSNLVYAVWDRLQPFKNPLADFAGPTIFTRSTDGGVTWEPARVITKPKKFQQTLGNQILVRPDGAVFNFATYIKALKPGKARNSVTMQMSLDKGVTWSKPKRIIKTQPHSAFSLNGVFDPDPHSQASMRTSDIIPAFAVDPVTGALYAAWQDSQFNGNGFDEIVFAQSADGRKWTKPIKINLTPSQGPGPNRQAFNPSVRVAADSTICVTYYDFRFNDRNNEPPLATDVWAVFCKPTSGLATNWGNEVRLTDASFDFFQAPNAGGFFLGDYEGLAAAGNDFLAFWSQPQDPDRANIVFRRLTPVP